MSTSSENSPTKDTQVEETTETKETEKVEKEIKDSLWTPVWDNNVQAYYWWNTETNETTWINPNEPEVSQSTEVTTTIDNNTTTSNNPLDFLLDRIDNVVKKQLDSGEEIKDTEKYPEGSYYNQYVDPTYDYTDYTTQAHFNSRTGRFTAEEEVDRLNPEHLSFTSRATRQMQSYFDVDSYTEQRNSERTVDGRVSKKKPLTRKEIEYFKKMKKEKKSKRAREWLLQ